VSIAATFLAVLILPSCSGGCGEGPGADNIVAYVERWVRVLSSPGGEGGEGGEGTIQIELDVVPVHEGGLEGTPRLEQVAMHSSFLPGIQDAMDDGDHVFLAFMSEGLERELVSYGVARSADGGHRFVGGCMEEGEELLRDRLGSDYDATIEQVIGSTGPDRILRLLRVG
jgi:hypothetical protein